MSKLKEKEKKKSDKSGEKRKSEAAPKKDESAKVRSCISNN